MKTLLGKIIPFLAGLTSLSLFGIDASVSSDTIQLVIWIFRGFITLCIATIAYFLKGLIDDNKKANDNRDRRIDNCDKHYVGLIKITAAHEVMYQIWLDELMNDSGEHPEKRKTDKVRRLISQIAENEL